MIREITVVILAVAAERPGKNMVSNINSVANEVTNEVCHVMSDILDRQRASSKPFTNSDLKAYLFTYLNNVMKGRP